MSFNYKSVQQSARRKLLASIMHEFTSFIITAFK